jgi:two-component system, LytTR family, response regulator LytT
MLTGGLMRVLIVDKEQNDRSALANALATRKDIEAFDSAEDISEALEKLQQEEYDVVLLDSPIPEISEVELLGLLKKRNRPVPAVIIVTTRRQPAIAAIDELAVHYSLKPFSSERTHEDLVPVVGRKAHEQKTTLIPQLRIPAGNPSKIAIAMEGRVLLIDPAEVIAVEAEGNYVLLVRSSGSHLVRGCISTLAEKLLPYGFIQIHRCVLVNSCWVHGIHPRSTGEYLLCTRGGKEYPVSRTYKQNLRSLAPLWLGSDVLFAE